eukprot:6214500-Pleurochrysis_carterae.AAC.7
MHRALMLALVALRFRNDMPYHPPSRSCYFSAFFASASSLVLTPCSSFVIKMLILTCSQVIKSSFTVLLFLSRSHIWATGQDQVAVIKRQLQLCLPGVRIFLDVRGPRRHNWHAPALFLPHISLRAVPPFSVCKFVGFNCMRREQAGLGISLAAPPNDEERLRAQRTRHGVVVGVDFKEGVRRFHSIVLGLQVDDLKNIDKLEQVLLFATSQEPSKLDEECTVGFVTRMLYNEGHGMSH